MFKRGRGVVSIFGLDVSEHLKDIIRALRSLEQLYLVLWTQPHHSKELQLCVLCMQQFVYRLVFYTLMSIGCVCVMCDFFFLLLFTYAHMPECINTILHCLFLQFLAVHFYPDI